MVQKRGLTGVNYFMKICIAQKKTLRVTKGLGVVPRAGIEPARTEVRWILNPLRLPISPPRHQIAEKYLTNRDQSQGKNI